MAWLDGKKTYLAALLIGLAAALNALGYTDAATLIAGIGSALGLAGMGHKVAKATISALFCLVLLAGCATPASLLGGAGGAIAGTGETSARTTPIEAMIALQQPGAISGAENTRLSYDRAETGSQQAPAWALHLQPAEATGTASYPALTTINLTWVNMQGNSQRDGTLSPDQISGVAGIVTEAAKALESARSANVGAIVPATTE